MVDVSETGLKVDDEMELDLGLSIGGSFGKLEKLKPVKKVYALAADWKSNGYDVGLKENRPGFSRSCMSPGLDGKDAKLLDPQAKREMQALRRQEAKKKREEKQQLRRVMFGARNGENGNECQRKEEEEQPARKKGRTEEDARNVNLHMSNEHMQKRMQHKLNDVTNPVPFAVATVESPYPPTNSGLRLPCVMPRWMPGGGGFEPSEGWGFRPYNESRSPGHNFSNGCEREPIQPIGDRNDGNRKTASHGSPICSSSAGSEDPSSSLEGVGSGSDSISHSSNSLVEQSQLEGQKANDTKGQSKHSASSDAAESVYDINVKPTERFLQQNTTQPSPPRPKEESMPETEAKASDKHISNTENVAPCSEKETKLEMGKPPRPAPQTQNQNPHNSLPQMPCVSTTGNGPNGKTIRGFLYRYTKSEVSIICVCHGSSFSPAEFVQHAGGTDVSHPLKHITVIPSAFG
ncbi:uncharacterized protein LOC108980826 [Juglans regia]|uniref:Ninja-family protein n=2 Tax=Juglans regia TaxID=51240 RepID=A0A2I4DJR3_JUGRE|nr:uncharacterized protein LOC108980826 [Juglans regia]